MWPKIYEQNKVPAKTAYFLGVTGKIQRHDYKLLKSKKVAQALAGKHLISFYMVDSIAVN